MKTLSIVKFRERRPDENGWISFTFNGGKWDGVTLRKVVATLSDGTEKSLLATSNSKFFFKEVVVPWDFEHKALECEGILTD